MIFNPFSPNAVDLNSYVQAARPQVARMLGLQSQQTPQARVDQGFGSLPPSGPGVDFNQSFGGSPGAGPSDIPLWQKYMMAMKGHNGMPPVDPQVKPDAPGAPMSLAPPNPGPGSSAVQQSSPYFSDDFMGRFARMGSQPGAGLIPKLAYLGGFGRGGGTASGGVDGNLGGLY